MSYNIFIDDERSPFTALRGGLIQHDLELYDNDYGWIIVRTCEDFTKYVEEYGLPEYVSFDHDLADIQYKDGISTHEKTGYDCAKWLVNYCINNQYKFPKYQVHSANPIGKQNIISYIENYKKHFNI